MPTRLLWETRASDGVGRVVTEADARRVLVVTDPGVAATGLPGAIGAALETSGVDVSVHADVAGNPTTDDVAAARAEALSHGSDLLVAVGGGSAIDTAKAVAMLLANGGEYAEYQWDGRPITQRSRPLVAVPTTAGTGSEVSRVTVISDPSQPFKKGVLSPLMFAHAAVLDPEVTVGLPPHLTAATGIDALVHAIEAYVGRRANPMTDLFALEAMWLITTSLPRATHDGTDLGARTEMMRAAVYAGIAMDHAGLGLVHALSGGLCSHLHLHHGLANAMILPFVLDFNHPALDPDRRRVLHELFGVEPAAAGSELTAAVIEFVRSLGLPTGLGPEHVGTDAEWAQVADESMRMVMIANNPRPVDATDCRSILDSMIEAGG